MSKIEEAMKGSFESNPSYTSPRKIYSSCDDFENLDNDLKDAYYKYITKNNTYKIEQSINEKAMFALNNVKFTTIAVDSFNYDTQRNENNYINNIIFIGLSDGRIIKLLNRISPLNGQAQPMIVGEYQMFEQNVPVNNIMIYDPNRNGQSPKVASKKIIAVSNEEIKSFSLDSSCYKYADCAECIGAQDPYCSWSTTSAKCVNTLNKINDHLINDVQNGNLSICKNFSLFTLTPYIHPGSSKKEPSIKGGIVLLFVLLLPIAICSSFLIIILFLITKIYEKIKKHLLKVKAPSNDSFDKKQYIDKQPVLNKNDYNMYHYKY